MKKQMRTKSTATHFSALTSVCLVAALGTSFVPMQAFADSATDAQAPLDASSESARLQVDVETCLSVDGAEVARLVKADLQGVSYESDEIAAMLAPARFSMSEILNKKTEIFKATGRPFNQISDDEAKAELRRDNLKASSFDISFARVQQRIDDLVVLLVGHSSAAGGTAQAYADKIVANKEAVLVGLAYLDRLYGFDVSGKPLYTVMLENPAALGGSAATDVLDWTISIGNAGGEKLKLPSNVSSYASLIRGKGASAASLTAFLESVRDAYSPGVDMDAWFARTSKALIVEKESAERPDAPTSLYAKLAANDTLRAYILPFLNVSENSVYAASNVATITFGPVDTYVDRSLAHTDGAAYAAAIEAFETELDKAAGEQARYIDFWLRIAKPEVREKLFSDRLIIDSLRMRGAAPGTGSAEWSPRFGEKAALGVRELITPMGAYASFFQADGVAEAPNVRMYLTRALEKDGLSTYTHELTHLYEDDVWFAGAGSREGLDAEVFARGMFESWAGDEPVFNINTIYDDASSGRLYNASPERFENADDVQQYAQGMMDVLYTLDYAEAEAVLAGSDEEKARWFHKMEQQNDTRTRSNQGNPAATHKVDSVRAITAQEAAGLSSVDDLVDQDIVAARYEVDGLKTTGLTRSNGYYTVPLFTANYAAVENDNGVSGDVMVRRYAYDLLAEYGYYQGMVPYVSNLYAADAAAQGVVLSDAFVLPRIFGGQYATMADFKKGMFKKRSERKDDLKPVVISYGGGQVAIDGYDDLAALMKDAVAYDLANVHDTGNGWPNTRAMDTKTEQLKRAVYAAYLVDTDDFRASIYKDEAPEPQPEPGPDPEPQPEPQPEPGPDPEPQPQPEPGPEPEPEPEAPVPGTPARPTEPPALGTQAHAAACPSAPFADVSDGDWFHESVDFAAWNGIMTGISPSRFDPEGPTTRAMVAMVLWRMAGSPAPQVPAPFADVPAGAWHAEAVAWAAETGVAHGYGDGEAFGPDDAVTREQMAAFLARFASALGLDPQAPRAGLSEFSDADDVSPFARDALSWAVGRGLVRGMGDTGLLAPQGGSTRAQTATLLVRFCREFLMEG